MTALQTGDVCQSNNDPNNLFPIESLRFPLDIGPLRILFTGYYNGFSVEVTSVDEMALLHHMGCMGKGTFSRSKPRPIQSDTTLIMRKRQFLKRNYWYKKFGTPKQTSGGDAFIKEIDELTAKIIQDCKACKNKEKKDVIDLVSSDEEMSGPEDIQNDIETAKDSEKGDSVVIVPNSDSEDEDYFANLKPKCCLNKIKLQEKLMLTLQEAFFLLHALCCLQVCLNNRVLSVQQCWDLFIKTDKDFTGKYVVYHYYKSKGYVVKPGIKFGGDYLLYEEGPGVNHANYIVVIKSEQDKAKWTSILGHVRMAATTVKDIIIAEVIQPDRDLQLPQELNAFTMREITLSRKIPVTINEDFE